MVVTLSRRLLDKFYFIYEFLAQSQSQVVAMSAGSSSSGNSNRSIGARSFEGELRVRNELWRNYRIRGDHTDPSTADYNRIYSHVRRNPRLLPNPEPLLFFQNRVPHILPYLQGAGSGQELVGSSNRLSTHTKKAKGRYGELVAYFGEPRYVVQKPLGIGANGLAVHFLDRGPFGTESPGKDIVIKTAVEGWQCDNIEDEKRMMRKVKGSAHCVRIIEPQDIGNPKEEPVALQLIDWDSSTDGNSSGNDSSTRTEVLRRHRVPKRRSRGNQHWARKRTRRIMRAQEIDREIERQEERGVRRDYIIMEYLHNGSLASLLMKLNNEKEDPRLTRIPNRVLWGFWLCLIRACIAMEYPPRKFHPLRKKPEVPEGAVSFLQAKANSMLRECKRLGIWLFNPQEQAGLEAEYNQLEGDLVENIPNPTGKGSLNWKRERRQNMIHRDLDPTNIFVDGFELDGVALKHWQEQLSIEDQDESNPDDEDAINSPQGSLRYTGKRPDRLCQEHELVPRLKVGDFGLAVCIKQQKRNEYYLYNRVSGKHGEHPPECFGPEWERVEGGKDGDYLANSKTCGYYSNKSNIWSIGITMWELITKSIAPTPPIPQPPYEARDLFPPYNNHGQADYDIIFDDPRYADFKISYCPLLIDPEVHDFDWVDETLRQTILACLYHRPDDRPTLEGLLREAEENIHTDRFPDESDASIRDWIQYWFFDARPAPNSSPSDNAPPPDNPHLRLQNAIAQDNPNHPVRQRIQAQFDADFPGGFTQIPNPAIGLHCGLYALVDSLQSQLGLQPTINGITHNLNSLPTADDLLTIYQQLRRSGRLDPFFTAEEFAAVNNYTVDIFALILSEWGRTVGIELALGYYLRHRSPPVMHTASPYKEPKFIWIHNDNKQDINGTDHETLNNYVGIERRKSRPEENLADYESDG
ncbi:hypothetical protein F5Y03DRAFT_345215 [Xylaria venustula]|nr:hypothetical protein F5Y03DRAFT_345215 [Xylaria venustula]